MQALLRYPRRQRRAIAQKWARRSHAPGGKRERERLAAGPDLQTLVWRARHDRRGTVIRCGHLYRGDGRVQAWQVRCSVAGRSDQYDVLLDGLVILTGGPAKVAALMPGIRLLSRSSFL